MIETRPFGRTGHLSSRVIFGAAALSRIDQDATDRLLPLLLDNGINHLDTAATYGDSELRLAPWLSTHRERFFLATKTGDRSGAEARASLERSLERLGVDQIDLIQLHNLVEDDDFEQAHGKGGAVEALAKARDEGLVRFIGVTGHGTRIASMHLASLDRFDFDSVLFPYNYALLCNDAYRHDVSALLEVCADRNIATQTIKSIARRRWLENRAERRSWYQPLEDDAAIGRAVRFVLGNDQLFLNSSSDFTLLASTLACSAQPALLPSDEEMAQDAVNFDLAPLFDGAELERI